MVQHHQDSEIFRSELNKKIMLSRDEIFAILLKTLSYSDGDQCEALIISNSNALTRYSNSVIHQNVLENDAGLFVRTVKGKKTGTAISNSFSPDDLKRTVKISSQICDVSEENPDFRSLPISNHIMSEKLVCEKTLNFAPIDRAKHIKKFTEKADKFGLSTAGTFSSGLYQIGILNSLGINAYFETTRAKFVAMALENENSGYASTSSYSVDLLDIEKKSDIAIKKCMESRNPVEIKPGKYKVALEKQAVNDIIKLFSYTQFGALAKQEGRSMMAENIGKKIMSEKFTIYDDGSAKEGLYFPIDFEGILKEKVVLVDKGEAKNVVHDSLSAARDNVKSTGHALPPGNSGNPYPLNIFLDGGEKSENEIFSNIEDGLLITRFHYLNPFLNLKTALFTGTTRDGTFIIKNGKISKPVKNLRFTQSMIEAFSNIEDLSLETEIFNDGSFFTLSVPSMVLNNFNFSGNL